MPVRSASATWTGGLKDGKGSFKTESGLSATYNFSSRFGEERASNPEELLAAAEAACYAMALSAALEGEGHKGTNVQAAGKCTIEKTDTGMRITSIVLDVKVTASGLSDASLQKLATDTKKNCPVSKALTGTRIDVTATLT